MRHDDEITGVDIDNKITRIKPELESTGAIYEVDEMALLEEAISETERDIAEMIELLAGTET